MAITEDGRHQMYTRLSEVLSEDEGATPMAYPNTMINGDLDRLQTATRAEIREAVNNARVELRAEIRDLRLSLERERQARYELEWDHFRSTMAARRRTMLTAILASNGLIATLLVAMMRFS